MVKKLTHKEFRALYIGAVIVLLIVLAQFISADAMGRWMPGIIAGTIGLYVGLRSAVALAPG